MCIYIHMYIYIHIYTLTHICIYIYIPYVSPSLSSFLTEHPISGRASACCFTSSALSSVTVAMVSSLQPKDVSTSACRAAKRQAERLGNVEFDGLEKHETTKKIEIDIKIIQNHFKITHNSL